VLALAEFDDGRGGGPRLYAAGGLGSAGGVPLEDIAMWDGVQWSDVGGGVTGGGVFAMAVFDDGTRPALYVGGTFTAAGGKPIARIAKWNGVEWSAVGGGVSGGIPGTAVLDMRVWDDGGGPGLIVGGCFSNAGGVPTQAVARWRNGVWSGFGNSLGSAPYVKSIAIMPSATGSSLICAGRITGLPGMPFKGLVRWNGAAWEDIAPPLKFPGGQTDANQALGMLVGSCPLLFSHAWQTQPGWVRVWNGQSWRTMGAGLQDPFGGIWATIVTGGGGSAVVVEYTGFATFGDLLFVAGDFTSAGDLPASNIAIWDPAVDLACAADSNNDQQIDSNDLIAVILQWGPCGTACSADSAPCGGDGAVDTDDLIAVILAWGPCP
jgi:hypothetical protein